MTGREKGAIGLAGVVSVFLAVSCGAFVLPARDIGAAERRLARLEAGEPGDRRSAHVANPDRTRAVRDEVVALPRERPMLGERSPSDAPARRGGRDPLERNEVRGERIAQGTSRMGEYAQTHGWDATTTAAVREIMSETHDYMTSTMDRIEAGDATFEELRDEIVAFRSAQGEALIAVLGEDEAAAFTEALQLQRIFMFDRERSRSGGRRR